MTITVEPQHAGQRLDKFLKEQFPDYSRSYIQKTIAAGQILVNDKKVAVHHFLKIGDRVEVKIEPPKEMEVQANPFVKFEVIAEEEDFLVINKPVGLVVHQGNGHKSPNTLVNGILVNYPEIRKVGNDPVRPGIVHRLDRDVSGVMVIARTPQTLNHLILQFENRAVFKEYIALVYGELSTSAGAIELPLGRARKGPKMVVQPRGKGFAAKTQYEVIKAGGGFSLLKVETLTGRMHQIRAHFAAIGHPIVGDQWYGPKKVKKQARLMLHASKLGFYDREGAWREYEAPSPEIFL